MRVLETEANTPYDVSNGNYGEIQAKVMKQTKRKRNRKKYQHFLFCEDICAYSGAHKASPTVTQYYVHFQV